MPNRCKPSTSSVCPPDNSFDSEDGMPLLDVSLAESEGSREIPVVMPALVLKLTRDDSDGKPASLDEHSSPGVGPSGDLNLDDAMETDDGPYRDREFYMALETVDGIEETQLMSQCSVRKRDKKKRKSASDAARQAAKRLAESQEEREKRLESVAERDALRRSEMSEKERMIVNQRKRDKAAVARENESEEAANERREADAARTSARREAEDPESHAARNQDNAERTAAARANESPDETAARRLADRQRRSNDPKEFVPLAGTDDHPGAHYIGRMDNPCRHCGALYFRAETTTKGQYTMCCANGSIDIPMPPPLPTALQDLYLLDDDEGERKDFIDNIRQYNNSMAMACMKAEVKLPSGGWYTYRIHKQVYHLLGDLHPAAGQPRNFAQIFILDTAQAAAELAGRDMNSSCSEALFAKLIDIIKEHHPHAKTFKMMFEKEQEEKEQAILEGRPERRVTMTFRIRSQDDQNRYQNPTADEVAAVYVGDEEEIPGERGFTIHQRGSPTPRAMNIIDRNVDPLTYPLLFPRGQFGWTINMPYRIPRGNRENITMVEFYAHRLHVRKEFSPLFHAGKLFQQFVVDVWTRVEQNRLNFIKSNQALLRSEHLRGLQDYVAGEENGPIGRIILPASHSGSPRDMVQQYQDAMTVVSRYGKPDFFLTMTCNPKWREIQECLAPGQVAVDRPDVVARVFKLKVDELRNDLFKRNVLGRVLAYIFVVEFQKRGLPHIHMLLIMETGSKLRTTADVDRFISARLPDKNENPLLYDLVTSLMMHRPCGVHNPKAPCMKNDVCSKKFRKPFRETTSIDNDGYALYARPDDGRTFEVKVNSSTVIQTNQDVVPYCAWLIEKYQCHINLEYCGTFSSVKYLYKYVYKGTTRACILIKVDQHGNETVVSDEIQQFLDTRYVCAPEAAHHIFQFPMSYRSVSVSQLPIHLPGEKTVIFEAGKESEAVDRARTKKSKLEAWFKVNDMCHNSQLPNGDLPAGLRDSRKFFYHEMPEHFVFNASSSTWQPRQKQFAIGRMYFISPRDREKFALRQLLLYTKGSRSFQDLRTVQGYEWPTFVEAARAAGFLSDDLIYEKTLQEAVEFKTGSQLRSLFVTLLLFETIDNAEELWNKFSKHLSDDFVNKGYTQYEAESLAYYEMMDRMEAASEDLRKWINRSYPRIFRRGDDVDIEKCKKEGEDALTKLNKEQREAVDAILGAKNSLRGGLFFIDGPGGTGKTFVYNCLANLVLGSGEKILPMSWVGIAAALLPGGRTVASAIKLDINNGCRSSGVNLKSPLADVLRQVSLILWDEAPMSPKASLETVDTLFRKLMDVDTPFGGKTVVLGGDFRQVLPVMDKGGAAEQIANSIKKSGLWPLFQVFHLKTNVRVTADALEWSKELLKIGDGKVGAKVTGEMPIPDGLESGGDLITEIFGDLLEKGEVEKLAKVAILTPRNKEALETNNKVLDKMGGAPRIYRSLDTISPKDGQLQVGDFNHFTTEFLNTMTPSGMPPHELRVKNGAIVMLLRNLDVKNGLCNGTRMVVEEMGERILQCKFINGPRKDESVLIPRIKLNYEKNLPFIMGRLQFPIRLAFAMTVNKSQGQTFERIGLLLDEPIFSHGQFYVALSRTTTREGVKINSKSKKVNNVVYPEVLLD